MGVCPYWSSLLAYVPSPLTFTVRGASPLRATIRQAGGEILSGRPDRVAQHGAEGDGVAQRLGGGNAVLPFPARVALHDIGRARLEHEVEGARVAALCGRVGPEAHARGVGERDADDDAEL